MIKYTVAFTLIFVIFFNAARAAVKSDTTLNAAILGVSTENIDHTVYSKVFYVSVDSGSDKKDYGTRQKPWRTVIYALSQVPPASATDRYALFIAEGLYTHGTLAMEEHLDMFGGFDGQFEQRDVFKFATILDGQGLRRVIVAADHTILDGFTIRNGLSRDHGAGILCMDVSPQISNNFIIANHVLEPADFDPSHIHQEGNNGGGIACLYNAVPVIRNNIFYNNKTSIGTGAAISFYGWVRHKGGPEMSVVNNRLSGGRQGRVENNVIIHNTSGLNDLQRTRSSSGGGISCAFEARPLIQNNLVAMNRAMGRSDAGGIYCEYFSDPFINGNWVLGNISDDDGGGFYTMKMGMPLLSNNIFAGNYTTGGGVGAIRISKEGRARITDNTIVYNPGGGVMSVDAYMELEDNIIMNNPAGSGLRYVMSYSYFNPAVVRNNIIEGNEKGQVTVVENAGHELRVDKDAEISVPQTGDAVPGRIKSVSYNDRHYMSSLSVEGILPRDDLSGRVIRAGEQWSLVKSITDNTIIVWGKITQEAQEFEIISSFAGHK